MKTVRTVGAILVALGAIAIIGSALVDLTRFGAPGFGVRQIAGIVFGVIDGALGVILLVNKR